ncbi:MAG: Gfo/Idh/MocA family oxidoreductase [Pseudomonadota bacterium]
MRWGLLATGTICRLFARDLAQVPGAELAAVASRDGGRATAFAEEFGFTRAHASYDALFADPDIDIVYIGTPHSEHTANAAAAMRAGKHVVCEKPLTVTPDECRALIEVHKETRRYAMEAMWTWFLPAIRQTQQWVAAGRIGALHHIKADFGYPMPFDPDKRMFSPELAGGCLLDMGVYPVALSWLMHKAMPTGVQVIGRRAPTGVDDDFSAIFEYEDHTATLGASFRSRLPNFAYLIGSEGYIAIPDFWRASEAKLFDLTECVDHFTDDRVHMGFAYEAIAAQRDIMEGKLQSDIVSLTDSLAIQTLMDAVRKAM